MVEKISAAKARRTEWMAHHEPWMWPVVAVLALGTGEWADANHVPWGLCGIPFLLAGVYINACGVRHRTLSCYRCWRAEPPASSARFVTRKHRRALWWAHSTNDLGLWLIGPFAVALFIPHVAVFLFGLAGLVAVASSTAWSVTKHKQLARWCPRCPRHGGGGGGGTYAPPPVPVLSGSK